MSDGKQDWMGELDLKAVVTKLGWLKMNKGADTVMCSDDNA